MQLNFWMGLFFSYRFWRNEKIVSEQNATCKISGKLTILFYSWLIGTQTPYFFSPLEVEAGYELEGQRHFNWPSTKSYDFLASMMDLTNYMSTMYFFFFRVVARNYYNFLSYFIRIV